jgi:hypothetical protein
MKNTKEILQIINNHALPSTGQWKNGELIVSRGFIRDIDDKFNKIACDIEKYYEAKLKNEYEKGLKDGYECIPKI